MILEIKLDAYLASYVLPALFISLMRLAGIQISA